MPKLDIRERRRQVEVRARRIRRVRLAKEAKQTIDLVRLTGIGDRQGVVMLIFDLAEGDMIGYTNVDPVMAAVALIEYLEQTYPRSTPTLLSARDPKRRRRESIAKPAGRARPPK
jgi:hypothetical protein